MEKSQERQFDEQMRRSLRELASDRTPRGWEELSSKLESGQEPFDLALREKLSTLGNNLPVSGWETLEQRLDQTRAEAADRYVKQSLAGISPRERSGGWAALAARLELIAYRRQSLAALKLTEVSLALSILLLFWRFGPLAPQQPIALADFPAVEISELSLEETGPGEALTTARISEERTPAGHYIPTVDRSASTLFENLAGEQESTSTQPTQSGTNLLPNQPLSPLANQVDFPLDPSFAASAIYPQPLSSSLSLLTNDLGSPNPGPLALTERLSEVDGGIHSYLRIFYSPVDLNQVITPENAFFDRIIERDNRLTYGHSGGILIDIASRQFSLNTGLIYGLRSYIPTVLKQDLAEPLPSPIAVNKSGYSRLTFHTVSIPLTINKTIINNDRWRVTLGGGAGLTMVLSSSFNQIEGADELLSDLLTSQTQGVGRGGFQDRFDAREYFNPEPGWFQGGSIFSNANFYLTGSASFERKLGDRWSLFASPTISRYFHFVQKGGLGPNYDRIHNHAVYFGTRVRLGSTD